MKRPVLFFDDGGVLNDNAVRGPQWQRLVAEYFAPRLGGDPAAWAEANRVVTSGIFYADAWDALLQASAGFADYEHRYFSTWLGGMWARVGVPAPAEAECVTLGRAAEAFIIPQIRAAIPGAAEAVRALHAAGYTLHTASGGGSLLLDMYLQGMDIRACFGRLYGPDLIGAFKQGPDYYARILETENLTPGEALFLDDSPKAMGWARETGARTLLVGKAEANGFERIGSLAELPGWLVERN